MLTSQRQLHFAQWAQTLQISEQGVFRRAPGETGML
jgi:hypothetical protein